MSLSVAIEKRIYAVLAKRGPATSYGYQPGVIYDVILCASIPKSIYYSWRHNARIIVDRRARIRVDRTAKIVVAEGGALLLGIAPRTRRPSTITLKPRSRLVIDGLVTFMAGVRVHVHYDAELTLSENSYLNEDSRITCHESITIGARCAISWDVDISDGDGHRLEITGRSVSKPVRIGDRVWIGAGARVLKGVTLGNGAIVGAGSVVTRDVAERQVVGGNPAKVVREGVSWSL